MKNFVKILIIFFFLISGTKGFSQTIPKADSLRMNEKGVQTSTAAREQNANGLDNRGQARKNEVSNRQKN